MVFSLQVVVVCLMAKGLLMVFSQLLGVWLVVADLLVSPAGLFTLELTAAAVGTEELVIQQPGSQTEVKIFLLNSTQIKVPILKVLSSQDYGGSSYSMGTSG